MLLNVIDGNEGNRPRCLCGSAARWVTDAGAWPNLCNGCLIRLLQGQYAVAAGYVPRGAGLPLTDGERS